MRFIQVFGTIEKHFWDNDSVRSKQLNFNSQMREILIKTGRLAHSGPYSGPNSELESRKGKAI